MATLACSPLTSIDNHSDDTVRVFHGAEFPAFLCGFHASYLTPASWRTMRKAGTVPATPDTTTRRA